MTGQSEAPTEQRLRRIEDHLDIYQIISAFGAAADSTTLEIMYQLWDESCELVIGAPVAEPPTASASVLHGVNAGHQGLHNVMTGEYHKALVAHGSAHINSLPHIEIEGDRAVATTYQTLFLFKDPQFALERLTAARWEFRRTHEGWRIARRTTELLDGGNQKATELLAKVMDVR